MAKKPQPTPHEVFASTEQAKIDELIANAKNSEARRKTIQAVKDGMPLPALRAISAGRKVVTDADFGRTFTYRKLSNGDSSGRGIKLTTPPIIPRELPPKPEKRVKASKLAKPKRASVPDGYTTITDLAKSWGVEPSDCRAMLRASSLVKPEYGWAFSNKDVPKIKKICGVK